MSRRDDISIPTGFLTIRGATIQQMRFIFFIVFMLPRDVTDAAVSDLTALLESGLISAPIHACLPLEKIAEAHDLVDAKSTFGNIVITLDS